MFRAGYKKGSMRRSGPNGGGKKPLAEKKMSVAEMRVTDCPVSLIYDRKHVTLRGSNCKFRHTMYRWEGKSDNRVGLIADSLCKWVRYVPHLNVQSVPGLTLPKTLTPAGEWHYKCGFI